MVLALGEGDLQEHFLGMAQHHVGGGPATLSLPSEDDEEHEVPASATAGGPDAPLPCVREALEAVRTEAAVVDLLPKLTAAPQPLSEYLFRCPVPQRVDGVSE